jgi:hypothetical protein
VQDVIVEPRVPQERSGDAVWGQLADELEMLQERLGVARIGRTRRLLAKVGHRGGVLGESSFLHADFLAAMVGDE